MSNNGLKQYMLDEAEAEMIETRRKNFAAIERKKVGDQERSKCMSAYTVWYHKNKESKSFVSFDDLFRMHRNNNNDSRLEATILSMKDFICGLDLDDDYDQDHVIKFIYAINKCLKKHGLTQRISDFRYQGTSRYYKSGYFLYPGTEDYKYMPYD